MTAAVALAQFMMVELTKLGESPLNPRKHFDEAKQKELNASVAAKGVLEPLLVRPSPKSKAGQGFEVVAGARRYRAAVAAKLKEVPCMVRELSDVEALELAVIENVEREDITALEEGDAYRELLKRGQTVEQLVAKTGRPRTTIFKRLKLAELVGPVRAMVASGKLTASVGELIARLPTSAAQEEALKCLEDSLKYSVSADIGEIPFRDAQDTLNENFRLHLSKATFDIKDATLVPLAGSCTACPKHTGADKETFHDVKADTCLDSVCWKKKGAAALAVLKTEVLEKTGAKLVKESKLENDSYYGPKGFTAASAAKYSKPSEEIVQGKTWKDLLGADVPKVVVLDGKNKTHNLVDKKAALKLLEEKDAKAAAKVHEQIKKAAEPKKDDWQARQAADQKKRQARQDAQRVVRTAVLRKVPKLETAVELLLLSHEGHWDWRNAIKLAGHTATKLAALKPAQFASVLVARSMSASSESEATGKAAKLMKLDLKKLEKKALEAKPGICFACGKGTHPLTKTVCVACGGDGED